MAPEIESALTLSLDEIIKQDGAGGGRGRGRGKGSGKGKGKASGTGGKGRGKKAAQEEESSKDGTDKLLDMALDDVMNVQEKSEKKQSDKEKGKGRPNSKGKDNSEGKGSSKGKNNWTDWSSSWNSGSDGGGDRKGYSKGSSYNSSWSDKGSKGSKGSGKSGSASSWGGSYGKGKGGGGSSGGTPPWNEHDDWRHGDDEDDYGYGGKGKGKRGSDWDDWEGGQKEDRWSNGRSGGSGGGKWGSWDGQKGGKSGKDDDSWGRGGRGDDESWGGSGSWGSRDAGWSDRPSRSAWEERSRRPDPPEAPPRGTWNRAVGATRENEREDRGGASSRNGYASRKEVDVPDRSDRGWSGAPQKRKHPGDDMECKNVKVTNIPRDLEMQDIKDAFEQETGRITRCKMDRGTAWIAFSRPEHARKAVDTFDMGELNGQTIGVVLDT
mmetsp:Transcript_19724/g.35422  ORF Transcript_19724/g.35422 Transcript_19724/m.35422 type:complete len:437 (+) Transcript_19724:3-1313(+)